MTDSLKMWLRAIPLVLCALALGLSIASIISYDWMINAVKDATRNPEEMVGGEYKYFVERLGSWLACFREVAGLNGTCSVINLSCASKPCWLRRDGSSLCGDAQIKLISNCTAFNAVRFLLLFGTFFETGALLLHFAWMLEDRFGFFAGSIGLFGAILNMCSYIVFQVVFVNQSELKKFADLGWGFYTLLFCWIPGLLAGFYTLVLTSIQARREKGGDGDESNGMKNRFTKRGQYHGAFHA